ncbi:HIT-like domain-containing protein [Trichoderma chlorosporum]
MLENIKRFLARMKKISNYLANLEWTERPQPIETCKFCDPTECESIMKYQNDKIKVVLNKKQAGEKHWLIMPIGPKDQLEFNGPRPEHVRDIENLDSSHLDLLRAMDEAKRRVLQDEYPGIHPSEVHCGYHRGRRPLIGKYFYPDTISVHHLHLHVIVRTQFWLKMFKYPSWLPLMWKSDQTVLQALEAKSLRKKD